MFILNLLLGCSACTSCASLDLGEPSAEPSAEPSEPSQEDSGSEDSGEDIVEGPCPYMEEEPNDSYSTAQYVPMETWFCGDINHQADLDVFEFDFPHNGWLKVWIRAQELGSSADVLVTLKEGSDIALTTFYLDSTDPTMVVPVQEATTLYAAVQEQYTSSGDNHFWQAMITEVKPPIEYDMVEDESEVRNDGMADGIPIEQEERIFGVLDSNFDRDWYLFDLPAGEHELIVDVESNEFGSPADMEIHLYPPEAINDPNVNRIALRNNGLNPNSMDPYLKIDIEGEGQWGIMLTSHNNTGSQFYWYVVDVSAELIEE